MIHPAFPPHISYFSTIPSGNCVWIGASTWYHYWRNTPDVFRWVVDHRNFCGPLLTDGYTNFREGEVQYQTYITELKAITKSMCLSVWIVTLNTWTWNSMFHILVRLDHI